MGLRAAAPGSPARAWTARRPADSGAGLRAAASAALAGLLALNARQFGHAAVVAEGIGTHGQLARVRQMGATIGQGYLLGRPITALQVRRLQEPMLAPA